MKEISFKDKIKLFFKMPVFVFSFVFTLFGVIFISLMMGNELLKPFQYIGEKEEVVGKIISVDSTNTKVNERTVYKIHYAYQTDQGAFEGNSYTEIKYSDSSYEENEIQSVNQQKFAKGEPVKIEVMKANSAISKIKDTRPTEFPNFLYLFLLFPIVGLWLMIKNLKKGIEKINLVKNGIETEGIVVKTYRSGLEVNDVPEYILVAEFKDQNGLTHQIKDKTFDYEKTQELKKVKVIYDKRKPSIAIIKELLEINIDINKKNKGPFIK